MNIDKFITDVNAVSWYSFNNFSCPLEKIPASLIALALSDQESSDDINNSRKRR